MISYSAGVTVIWFSIERPLYEKLHGSVLVAIFNPLTNHYQLLILPLIPEYHWCSEDGNFITNFTPMKLFGVRPVQLRS